MTVKKRKGHPESAATRAKISAALKAYHKAHPSTGKKKPHKGHPESAKTKAKISKALKAYDKAHPRTYAHRKGHPESALAKAHESAALRAYYKAHPRKRKTIARIASGAQRIHGNYTDRSGPKIAGSRRPTHQMDRGAPHVQSARTHLRTVRTVRHRMHHVHTVHHRLRRARVVRFHNPLRARH